MDKNNPALLLYFTASLVYVLSIVLHWDAVVTFLFKPIIVPAIYFYYWQESNGKVRFFPSLLLCFFYAGDMMILIEYENLFIPLTILNLSAYFVLIFYVAKDLLLIKNPKISRQIILIIFAVIAFLLSVLYVALSLVFSTSDSNYGLLIIYGVTLVLLGIGATLYYVLVDNESGFFLSIAVLSFIICDMFYVLYNYYANLEVFVNINIFAQTVSFYFIVKYFIYRKKQSGIKITYEK